MLHKSPSRFFDVSLSVCLSVCQTITFQRLDIASFAHPVYLQRIRVKFVHEGHPVKVKVTGAKKSKIPIPAMSIGNISGSIKHRAMELRVMHGVFGYGGSNVVTAIFVG